MVAWITCALKLATHIQFILTVGAFKTIVRIWFKTSLLYFHTFLEEKTTYYQPSTILAKLREPENLFFSQIIQFGAHSLLAADNLLRF